MSDKELIDPLNPDTYDERVIVQSGIRSTFSHISEEKWQRAFGWKIKFTWRRRK